MGRLRARLALSKPNGVHHRLMDSCDSMAFRAAYKVLFAPLRAVAADVVIELEGLRFSRIEMAPLEATVKIKEGRFGNPAL